MTVVMALLRATHLLACLSLAGTLVFARVILEPSVARAGSSARVEGDVLRRGLLRLAWAALAIALASGALSLVAEASIMSGLPATDLVSHDVISKVLTGTQFGRVWSLRLALLAILAACLVLREGRGTAGAGRMPDTPGMLLALSFLVTLAWAGHAAAREGSGRAFHLAGDAIHLAAAGAWLGGFLPLAALLDRAMLSAASFAIAREASRRYSALAQACVGALLVTGFLNAWFLLGSLPALTGSEYGRILLGKLALFTLLLALAARNRSRLVPRLLAAGGTPPPAALRALRRNVLLEAALGIAIVFVVGWLGGTPPAAGHSP